MLHASAQAWNRGDLDAFLSDYAADATFVSPSGFLESREAIRRRYMAGYWSTGMPEDALRFELIDARWVGDATALAAGRYILYDRETETTTASGLFSLTLEPTAEGWKIVHDHSSAEDRDGG